MTYDVELVNPNSAPVTAALTAEDSDPVAFSSSLAEGSLVAAPGGKASTTLTVTASAEATGALVNDTVVVVTVGGVDQIKITIQTRLLTAQFQRTLSGMGVSDHSVSPSAIVEMQIGVTAPATLSSAVLSDLIPSTWIVLEARGGRVTPVDKDTQKIEWDLGDLTANAVATRTYRVSSPGPSLPPPKYSFTAILSNADHRLQSEPWEVLLTHPLTVAHYRIGWDSPIDSMNYVADVDTQGKAIPRYKAFRVRFRIVNDGSQPILWAPLLEWSTKADAGFQQVPPGDWEAGQPFYVRPLRGIDDGATIPAAHFGLGGDAHKPQDGLLFTQRNPGLELNLDPYSYTEIEFSVRATVDASYGSTYYFRLQDDERPLTGQVASILMDSSPPVDLTEPQLPGIRVSVDSATSLSPSGSSGSLPTGAQRTAAQGDSGNPHGPYTASTGACASCHRSHTASERNLVPSALPESGLCLSCHNGTGSSIDISGQFSDPSMPADDAGSSSFYAHRATAPSSHTQATKDEFHNALNRHSTCSDCHSPHSADGTAAASSANGYTASGALRNISGVSTSGTWKSAVTYEYELCYKCHSSYTQLLGYSKESDKMWDKAAEFDPGGASYHPVEQAGKNGTGQMGASLQGTSPYKLWNFNTGDVIRCVNCHGDYRLGSPSLTPQVLPGARLAPHSSPYRGLLMNNLRGRALKPPSATDNYDASDFALCYQCHSEAPFRDISGDPRGDTNFRFHGYHVSSIYGGSAGGGSSTDIDTPGAGQGNAICSECHYRIHGQGPSARGNASGSRLVSFAPNVVASGSQLSWDPASRTCALSCHGANHNPEPY